MKTLVVSLKKDVARGNRERTALGIAQTANESSSATAATNADKAGQTKKEQNAK